MKKLKLILCSIFLLGITHSPSNAQGYIPFRVLKQLVYADYEDAKSHLYKGGWLYGSGTDTSLTMYYPDPAAVNWKYSANIIVLVYQAVYRDGVRYKQFKSADYITSDYTTRAPYTAAIKDEGYKLYGSDDGGNLSMSYYYNENEILQFMEVELQGKRYYYYLIKRN